jgi:hypothetical protein
VDRRRLPGPGPPTPKPGAVFGRCWPGRQAGLAVPLTSGHWPSLSGFCAARVPRSRPLAGPVGFSHGRTTSINDDSGGGMCSTSERVHVARSSVPARARHPAFSVERSGKTPRTADIDNGRPEISRRAKQDDIPRRGVRPLAAVVRPFGPWPRWSGLSASGRACRSFEGRASRDSGLWPGLSVFQEHGGVTIKNRENDNQGRGDSGARFTPPRSARVCQGFQRRAFRALAPRAGL